MYYYNFISKHTHTLEITWFFEYLGKKEKNVIKKTIIVNVRDNM